MCMYLDRSRFRCRRHECLGREINHCTHTVPQAPPGVTTAWHVVFESDFSTSLCRHSDRPSSLHDGARHITSTFPTCMLHGFECRILPGAGLHHASPEHPGFHHELSAIAENSSASRPIFDMFSFISLLRSAESSFM